MHELQARIIEEMGVKPTIDPAAEVRSRVGFLKDYVRSTGTRGFVLGISGGLDSTLAGRLAQLAVDELRSEGADADFIAIRLPYNVQKDEEDAQAALAFIQPRTSKVFNVAPAVDGIQQEYVKTTGESISDFTKGNAKARARMMAQYAIAGQHNLLVVGTDHGAESVTGFFTKFGDGGADVLPLFGLDKRQNRAVLKELGAPAALFDKIPTADLLDELPGRADEHELGLTYEQIDDYLEGREVDTDAAKAIEHRYWTTRHKRAVPVTMFDSWWRE
ncbi:NAD+ synthase [Arthrobacter sp. CAN_A2]|uniref:ammonia-dependent NAD(+) synthetase n=1 Tax=Arthrobacter sp. CAN_A2 TaxID=2787718 RepID=UPI0018EF941B